MKPILLILTLGLWSSFSVDALAAPPGDSTTGKKLHDTHCLKCHDTGVYTRPDRRVDSLAALNRQLDMCLHAAQTILSNDERRDLLKYVNDQFYHLR